MTALEHALTAGYGAMTGWCDLLDRINVFPVADGDTGANLRISLALLADPDRHPRPAELAACCVGNSGNIAGAFFAPLLETRSPGNLTRAVERGSRLAREAVAEPAPGAMLDIFSCLADSLDQELPAEQVIAQLRHSVLRGPELLPRLAEARVVDAGALAMYIFFCAFFQTLTGNASLRARVVDEFANWLTPKPGHNKGQTRQFCVDFTLQAPELDTTNARHILAGLGDSLVSCSRDQELKVHIHTSQPETLRARLGELGSITGWRKEHIRPNHADEKKPASSSLGIITDAAGSLPPDLARRENIVLLESMIVDRETARPEGCWDHGELYLRMREGERIRTAQSSVLVRQQQYQALLDQYSCCIYLAAGSAYTGNVQTARRWREKNDPDRRFLVLDSGAASGRLGLMALLCSRFARMDTDPETVAALAFSLITSCRELLFVGELTYLARSGRISRAKSFFAGLVGARPVIEPRPGGVRKVAVLRRDDQALALLDAEMAAASSPPEQILLQYTDNRKQVEEMVLPWLRTMAPDAEILIVPLSLTSGVHLGPGTWGVAWHSPEVSRHGHPVFARSWLPT